MIPSTSQNESATSSAKSAQSSQTGKKGSGAEDVSLPEFKTALPIIYSMGKVNRKKAKRMINGKGLVIDDVDRAVEFAAKYVKDDGKRTVMVPVVLFFEHKRQRRRRFLSF